MPRASDRFVPGSPAPHFSLPDLQNRQVGLAECLVTQAVWIEFIRGTWCPTARKRLTELQSALDTCTDLELLPLLIVSEDAGNVQRYFERNPSPLTILLDPRRKLARAYGVYSRLSLDGWNVARASSFIVDRAGFLRHIFISGDQTETCPLEEVLEVARRLQEEFRGSP